MRVAIIFICFFTLHSTYGQDTLWFGVTTSYGKRITDPQKVVHSGKLDLYFYQKHFNTPSHLPDRITNSKYKNDTLTIWSDSTKIGDINSTWSNTIIYDSLSRVSSYKYSSCVFCSQLAYDYHYFYNQNGQIIKITNNLDENEAIKLQYDAKGNIINVKVFYKETLTKEIFLLK